MNNNNSSNNSNTTTTCSNSDRVIMSAVNQKSVSVGGVLGQSATPTTSSNFERIRTEATANEATGIHSNDVNGETYDDNTFTTR